MKQTEEQSNVLNMLAFGDEADKEAAKDYLKMKSGADESSTKDNESNHSIESIDYSYITPSVYQTTPDYLTDLYRESNLNFVNNLEPADVKRLVRDLTKAVYVYSEWSDAFDRSQGNDYLKIIAVSGIPHISTAAQITYGCKTFLDITTNTIIIIIDLYESSRK